VIWQATRAAWSILLCCAFHPFSHDVSPGPLTPDSCVHLCVLMSCVGADIMMVKPGMPYLDVVRSLRDNTTLPIRCENQCEITPCTHLCWREVTPPTHPHTHTHTPHTHLWWCDLPSLHYGVCNILFYCQLLCVLLKPTILLSVTVC
jgi:hypothetical protein